MNDTKARAGRSRLAVPKTLTPDWFGWLGVAAMFLLFVAKLEFGGGAWFFPLLSLGEWLLLPLGGVSMIMGLLSLGRIQEKTLLPMWLAAVVPGGVWLAGSGIAILHNGVTPAEGDIFLSWAVRLLFPTMAFLPLLAQRLWRNRLMWALTAGLGANILLIIVQTGIGAGHSPGLGGLLCDQHDYGMALAITLPLLAAWRGGELRKNRAMWILLCTFLIPALAMSAAATWAGIAAAAVGLAVSWAMWRSPAWVMGIFICLLLFGYGSGSQREREAAYRTRMIATLAPDAAMYSRAAEAFKEGPYLGDGPDVFITTEGRRHLHSAPGQPEPWYATLLGGTGLFGTCLWFVMLAEIAARVVGRGGRRCLWNGGVLGALFGLIVSGIWTDALPEGAGALVGLLLAISILEEPETAPSPRQVARKQERQLEAVRRETIIRVKEGVFGDELAKLVEDETIDS